MTRGQFLVVLILAAVFGFGLAFGTSALTWEDQLQEIHEINALHD